MISKGSTKIDDIWCISAFSGNRYINRRYTRALLKANYILKHGDVLYLRYNNSDVEGTTSDWSEDFSRLWWEEAKGWLMYVDAEPRLTDDGQKVYKIKENGHLIEATDEELQDALRGDLLKLGAFND
jgi:hypothetical protein